MTYTSRTSYRTVRPATQSRIPAPGRQPQTRGFSRRRKPTGTKPTLGILSIVCFVLFWLGIFLAMGLMMDSARTQNLNGFAAGGLVGLVSMLFPIGGTVLGIIGLVAKRSNRIVAGIGLGLNLILGLWLLISSMSKHG